MKRNLDGTLGPQHITDTGRELRPEIGSEAWVKLQIKAKLSIDERDRPR